MSAPTRAHRWFRPLLQAITHIAGLTWRNTRQGRFGGRLIAARRRYVARVKHTPSAVQLGDRYQPRPRIVAASKAALQVTGRQIARTARRFRMVVQFGAEDTNKDLHRLTWRKEYQRAYRGMTGAWDAHQPRGGTHAGGRLIDWIGTLGRGVKLTRSWISKVPKPKTLDHTAIVVELTVRIRRRRGTVIYRTGYASGRFDAPTAETSRYLRALVHTERLDLLWSDEAQKPGLLNALREAMGPGFTVLKTGEYVQISRNATVEAERPRADA